MNLKIENFSSLKDTFKNIKMQATVQYICQIFLQEATEIQDIKITHIIQL